MAGYRFGILVRVPRRLMIGMGITAVVLYSTILTFEGSVIRSILMGSLGALAMLRGTGRNTLSALATTIVFCLIAAPKLAGDLGFITLHRGYGIADSARTLTHAPLDAPPTAHPRRTYSSFRQRLALVYPCDFRYQRQNTALYHSRKYACRSTNRDHHVCWSCRVPELQHQLHGHHGYCSYSR